MADITGTNGNETLTGTDENDVILGLDGADWLYGEDGDDVLEGGNGDDNLDGGDGDDEVYGGDGEDRIYYDAQDSVIDGGGGDDTLDLTGKIYGQEIKLEDGGITDIEHVDGGSGGDVIIGSGDNNILLGNDGNDTLDGVSGANELDGGAGDDTLIYSENDTVVEGGTGNDTLDASQESSSLDLELSSGVIGGVENLVSGSGNDTLTGDDEANIIEGGGGNDIIEGGSGNDFLYGGDGDDLIYYHEDDQLVDAGAGTDTLLGGGIAGSGDLDVDLSSNQKFANFENVTGGDGDDSITGDGRANTLDGGDGSDYINGAGGGDTLYGGEGDDRLIYNKEVVLFDGGEGEEDHLDASNETKKLDLSLEDGGYIENIEHLTGGINEDRLVGNDDFNIISGGQGGDYIDGGIGDDELYGGDGDDTLVYDYDDSIVEGGAGIDTLDATESSEELDIDLSANDYPGVENVLGGRGDDIIFGDGQTNILDGGDGFDELDGGGGADEISGGDGDDLILYDTADTVIDGGNGNDTLDANDYFDVDLSIDLAKSNVIQNIENVISGDGDDKIHGTGGANSIDGAEGNDFINGRSGRDELYGGGGNDMLIYDEKDAIIDGGDDVDTLDASSSTLNLNFDLEDGDIISGIENLITGSGNDKIYGNQEDNSISSGSGNDVIDAGEGYDWVDAGRGDDRVIFDDTDEAVIGGKGNDILDASDSDTGVLIDVPDVTGLGVLVSGFETIIGSDGDDIIYTSVARDNIRAGAGDDSIDAGAGSDWINGNEGIDTIEGANGADFIFGGDGDDVLFGGNGNDFMSGGSGDDIIHYDAVDRITNGISGGIGEDTLTAENSTEDVHIDLEKHKRVIGGVENVTGSRYDDKINGNDGDNIIEGGDGHDVINGRGGEDTINGGAGDDRISFNANVLVADAGENDGDDDVLDASRQISGKELDISDGSTVYVNFETVLGGLGSDTITGSDEANRLYGNAGDDIIDGGDESDIIFAGDGDDEVIYDEEDERIDGGKGIDTLNMQAEIADLTIDMSAGDQRDGNYSGFEIFLTGEGDDTFLGSDVFDEEFRSGNGNDSLDGNGGGDALYGEDGDDEIIFYKDLAVADGGEGTDTIDATRETEAVTIGLNLWTSLNEVENAKGGDGEDTLIGSFVANVIEGGVGADLLIGAAGDDIITGDDGTSTDEDTGIVNDYIKGGDGDDTLSGGQFFDLIEGGDGDDALDGGEGNDFLLGGLGTNNLDGGDGDTDVVVYSRFSDRDSDGERFFIGDGNEIADGLRVDLTTGRVTANNGLLTDSLVNIERVYGSAGDDEFIGSTGDDYIRGGAGNDTIDGGTGDDILSYESGRDHGLRDLDGNYGQSGIIVNFSDESFIDARGIVSRLARVEAGTVRDEHGDTDTVFGIETVIGTDYRDIMIASDTESGIYIGGGGGDYFYAGDVSDVFLYNNSDGLDAGRSSYDTIKYFNPDDDLFYFEDLANGTFSYLGGEQFTGTGNTEARYDDDSRKLMIDFNGDGDTKDREDITIKLLSVETDQDNVEEALSDFNFAFV